MAIGKSKKQGKSKKGGKKKVVDPMTRKEWFTFRAPAPFDSHHFGYTPINRSSGTSKCCNKKFPLSRSKEELLKCLIRI